MNILLSINSYDFLNSEQSSQNECVDMCMYVNGVLYTQIYMYTDTQSSFLFYGLIFIREI